MLDNLVIPIGDEQELDEDYGMCTCCGAPLSDNTLCDNCMKLTAIIDDELDLPLPFDIDMF